MYIPTPEEIAQSKIDFNKVFEDLSTNVSQTMEEYRLLRKTLGTTLAALEASFKLQRKPPDVVSRDVIKLAKEVLDATA